MVGHVCKGVSGSWQQTSSHTCAWCSSLVIVCSCMRSWRAASCAQQRHRGRGAKRWASLEAAGMARQRQLPGGACNSCPLISTCTPVHPYQTPASQPASTHLIQHTQHTLASWGDEPLPRPSASAADCHAPPAPAARAASSRAASPDAAASSCATRCCKASYVAWLCSVMGWGREAGRASWVGSQRRTRSNAQYSEAPLPPTCFLGDFVHGRGFGGPKGPPATDLV